MIRIMPPDTIVQIDAEWEPGCRYWVLNGYDKAGILIAVSVHAQGDDPTWWPVDLGER